VVTAASETRGHPRLRKGLVGGGEDLQSGPLAMAGSSAFLQLGVTRRLGVIQAMCDRSSGDPEEARQV
jgi:hypothetical protein